MTGAILNTINTRLDAPAIAFGLKHCEARLLLADRDYADAVRQALKEMSAPPRVIDIVDPEGKNGHPQSMAIGDLDYEAFLATGDPEFAWRLPDDEWQSISLNYTSGTTGDPKGVVYHHRGAYLNAMGQRARLQADARHGLPVDAADVPLQRLDLSVGGDAGRRHACLPAPGRSGPHLRADRQRAGDAPVCGADRAEHAGQFAVKPTEPYAHPVEIATGGAAPPSA
jgi:acyl-CoA synthetase (AMP-forming)/AMP-acid ligase II